ncbi:MAG TPA: branched-chain-amino-acid transaminase [Elusimicrobiota bacterium]|nr:branched-chain-amino-acid transaminase [Elusimicrobiota bacterium]HNI56026.1 branched-chain-amino-acid transaminase [Elusimicrobiota bacterium]
MTAPTQPATTAAALPGGSSLQIFLNGRLVPKEQAVVSVFDHGLLYGDGVFEGIRAYNGRVFRLQEHLERLYRSARAIVLDIGMPLADMEKAVLDTLRANKLKDAYIRLVVTRGVGDLGLDPKKCPKATVFIIADRIALYPPECYTEGLEVNTVSTRRNSSQALNPNIKSLNYLNNILAKIEAGLSGAREAIMLSLEGYVAECTGDNIFFIKGNRLVTPPTVAGALEGITRAVVWSLASGAGLVPEEMLFTPFDLFTADEVFLTGTAAEVIPVVRIDARTIGAGRPGPKTQKLIQAFRELAGREGTPI